MVGLSISFNTMYIVDAKVNRDKSRAWRLAYPEKAKAVRKNWLGKLRIFLDNEKSSGCEHCGEKDTVCLDFHHRDPVTKEFNIGVQLGHYSLKRLKQEVVKCDVLCANCHRKFHAAERAAKKVN